MSESSALYLFDEFFKDYLFYLPSPFKGILYLLKNPLIKEEYDLVYACLFRM